MIASFCKPPGWILSGLARMQGGSRWPKPRRSAASWICLQPMLRHFWKGCAQLPPISPKQGRLAVLRHGATRRKRYSPLAWRRKRRPWQPLLYKKIRARVPMRGLSWCRPPPRWLLGVRLRRGSLKTRKCHQAMKPRFGAVFWPLRAAITLWPAQPLPQACRFCSPTQGRWPSG